MTPKEKLFAGAELFDQACAITLAGLRADYPQASETELRAKLKTLLTSAR